jgi:hypothetical protein
VGPTHKLLGGQSPAQRKKGWNMFILFGWRGVTLSAGKGEFFCPTCRVRRPYVHKKVRRFFTLFFIPIIPLDSLGEYVECAACHGSFKPEVLGVALQSQLEGEDRRKEQITGRYRLAFKQVAMLSALADGGFDEQELRNIQTVTGEALPLSLQVSPQLLPSPDGKPADLQFLADIAGDLSDKGKEMLLRAAHSVACTGRQPDDRQQDFVTQVATVLSSGHLLKIAQSLVAGDTRGAVPLPTLPAGPPPLA